MIRSKKCRLAYAVLLTTTLLSTPAFAQAPTDAQRAAIRSECRSDYEAHCASIPPGGAAAGSAPAGFAAGSAGAAVAAAGAGFGSALDSPGEPTARTAPAQPADKLAMFFCKHSSDAAPPGGMLAQCAS